MNLAYVAGIVDGEGCVQFTRTGPAQMITIVQVIRDLGLEPTPDLTWSVGAQIRDYFEAETGSLPVKALRPKTDGSGGTHCHAIYPTEWRPTIERIIKRHRAELAAQLDLFK